MAIKAGDQIKASDYTGVIWATVARVLASQWFWCDGSAQSRAMYVGLFGVLCPSSVVTITIASPGVITWTAHPLLVNDVVIFTTTGALPTGLTAGTKYYVISTTTNTFQVSTSVAGTAVNTSGSQSGTHTAQCFTYGNGDGSTTFNLPDYRGRKLVGSGTGFKIATIVSVASSIITASGLSNVASNEFQTGQAVLFTATTAGNLTTATVYYVIRSSNKTFQVATDLGSAQNGSAITLSGSEAGTFTLGLTTRSVGETGGEETHAMSATELISHFHVMTAGGGAGSGNNPNNSGSPTINGNNTRSTGGTAAMNTMDPYAVVNYMIHI